MNKMLNSICVVNQICIRSDVAVAIVIEDMCRTVETFSIAFLTKFITKNGIGSQRLNPIQERWNRSNRTGHSRYTKPPSPSNPIKLIYPKRDCF